jgi:hypothetical protein
MVWLHARKASTGFWRGENEDSMTVFFVVKGPLIWPDDKGEASGVSMSDDLLFQHTGLECRIIGARRREV